MKRTKRQYGWNAITAPLSTLLLIAITIHMYDDPTSPWLARYALVAFCFLAMTMSSLSIYIYFEYDMLSKLDDGDD